LRHSATSRKVAGSIPDGVNGILIDLLLPAALCPGFDSVSNRNEFQDYLLGSKGARCIWLTNLLSSYVDFLEIWEPQTLGTLRACAALLWNWFTFSL